MVSSSTTLVLRDAGKSGRALKVTLPASWMDGPCERLVGTWRKKYGADREWILQSDDSSGVEIPFEWPVAAALALYGSSWVVEERRDDEPACTLAEEGQRAYAAGDFEAAATTLTNALEAASSRWAGRPQVWATRGACAMMLGDYERCAADSARAAAAMEDSATRDALLSRCARARWRLGDFAGAQAACRQVLEEGAGARGDASEAATAVAGVAARLSAEAKAASDSLSRAARALARGDYGDCAQLAARVRTQCRPPATVVCAALEVTALAALQFWEAAADVVVADEDSWRSSPPRGATADALDRPACAAALKALSYAGFIDRALALANDWARARASRGWAASARDRLERLAARKVEADAAYAARDWSRAAELYKDEHPVFCCNRAAAFLGLGDPAKAEAACDAALDARPLYDRARHRRARCRVARADKSDDPVVQAALLQAAAADYDRLLGPDAAARAEARDVRRRIRGRRVEPPDDRTSFAAYEAYVRQFRREKPPSRPGPRPEPDEGRGEKNLFEKLGLVAGASVSEVKRRYRELALRLHPDKSSDPDADEKFRELHRVYQDLLSVVMPPSP